jgi:hypothetical protein
MSAPSSLAGRDGIEIRSFRVVFQIERRLHKFDRWRLPLPYGVPVRGIAYAAVTLLAIVLAGQLPGLGALLGAVPAPLRFVLLPLGVATLLARVRVDGRPAHRFLHAWLAFRMSPRTVDAFSPVPAARSVHSIAEEILLADGPASPDYRPAVIAGPATVVLGLPARATQRGTTLHVEQTGAIPLRRGKVIALKAGQSLRLSRSAP